jgi:hypothetical protein
LRIPLTTSREGRQTGTGPLRLARQYLNRDCVLEYDRSFQRINEIDHTHEEISLWHGVALYNPPTRSMEHTDVLNSRRNNHERHPKPQREFFRTATENPAHKSVRSSLRFSSAFRESFRTRHSLSYSRLERSSSFSAGASTQLATNVRSHLIIIVAHYFGRRLPGRDDWRAQLRVSRSTLSGTHQCASRWPSARAIGTFARKTRFCWRDARNDSLKPLCRHSNIESVDVCEHRLRSDAPIMCDCGKSPMPTGHEHSLPHMSVPMRQSIARFICNC